MPEPKVVFKVNKQCNSDLSVNFSAKKFNLSVDFMVSRIGLIVLTLLLIKTVFGSFRVKSVHTKIALGASKRRYFKEKCLNQKSLRIDLIYCNFIFYSSLRFVLQTDFFSELDN